jgi:hypothetical protein
MKNAFRILGVVLLFSEIIWLILSVLQYPASIHATPEVLALGNLFDGNFQLPADKIEAAFALCKNHMESINAVGNNLHLVSSIAMWLNFVSSSSITLILGYSGRLNLGDFKSEDTVNLSKKTLKWVGMLAATAAIMTALSNLSEVESKKCFARADQLQKLYTQSRSDISDTESVTKAEDTINKLRLEASR